MEQDLFDFCITPTEMFNNLISCFGSRFSDFTAVARWGTELRTDQPRVEKWHWKFKLPYSAKKIALLGGMPEKEIFGQ